MMFLVCFGFHCRKNVALGFIATLWFIDQCKEHRTKIIKIKNKESGRRWKGWKWIHFEAICRKWFLCLTFFILFFYYLVDHSFGPTYFLCFSFECIGTCRYPYFFKFHVNKMSYFSDSISFQNWKHKIEHTKANRGLDLIIIYL